MIDKWGGWLVVLAINIIGTLPALMVASAPNKSFNLIIFLYLMLLGNAYLFIVWIACVRDK